jgi:hypothetical protein
MSVDHSTVAPQITEISFAPGYGVTEDGRAWSRWTRGCKPRITDEWHELKSSLSRAGYTRISMNVNGVKGQYFIHRLVLRTFVGEPPEGCEGAHWDGNRTNNALSNLRWATSTENRDDQRRHGMLLGGEKSPAAKLSNAQIDEIRELSSSLSSKEIAVRFNISDGYCREIIKGLARTELSHAGRGRGFVRLRKGRTINRRWIPVFLEALSRSPNVFSACLVAKVDRGIAYDLRKTDPEFAEAWKHAVENTVWPRRRS